MLFISFAHFRIQCWGAAQNLYIGIFHKQFARVVCIINSIPCLFSVYTRLSLPRRVEIYFHRYRIYVRCFEGKMSRMNIINNCAFSDNSKKKPSIIYALSFIGILVLWQGVTSHVRQVWTENRKANPKANFKQKVFRMRWKMKSDKNAWNFLSCP